MPDSKVRVGGSGLTVLSWQGQTLAYLQTIQDTAPTPVAAAVPVQSITDETPSEIVTARAVGPGTLRLTFYEEWNVAVWQKLPGFESANSLLDVLKTQLALGSISCRKIIRVPNAAPRVYVYQGCMITDIDAGEQVNIASMVMPKGITVMYTKAIRV